MIMLAHGVIKFNISLHSCLVLLQAKKSSEYRLRMDTRKLNKVTVGTLITRVTTDILTDYRGLSCSRRWIYSLDSS